MQYRDETVRGEIQNALATFFAERGFETRMAANDNMASEHMVIFERFGERAIRYPDIWHVSLMLRLFGSASRCDAAMLELHAFLKAWKPTLHEWYAVMFCLHVIPQHHINSRIISAEWVLDRSQMEQTA